MAGFATLLLAATAVVYANDLEPRLIEANRLMSDRRFTEAQEVFNQVLPFTTGAQRAKILNNLGATYHQQALYRQAEPFYYQAVEAYTSSKPVEKAHRAVALSNLAEVQRALGRLAEAEANHRLALADRRDVFGEQSSTLAASYNSLGCIKLDQGRYPDAIQLFERAHALREHNGDTSTSLFAAILHNLGEANRLNGDLATAESFYRQALERRLALFGEHHPESANSANSLAALYHDQGRLEESMQISRRTLEIRRQLHGPNHPFVAITLNNLSLSTAAAGKQEESRRLVQEAISIVENSSSHQHLAGVFLINLAESYSRAGEYGSADSTYRKAISNLEQHLPDGVWHAHALTGLANIFVNQGKLKAAEQLLSRAIAIRGRTSGTDAIAYAAAQRDLALVFRLQKRNTEAARLERTLH